VITQSAVQDLTPRELVRTSPKCDRDIVVYGYLRGTNLKQGTRVHMVGVGDHNIVVSGLIALWRAVSKFCDDWPYHIVTNGFLILARATLCCLRVFLQRTARQEEGFVSEAVFLVTAHLICN